MELTWIYGDHTLLSSIKNDLEEYVKTELFQGKVLNLKDLIDSLVFSALKDVLFQNYCKQF